jgi:hypothetical protein
MSGFENNVINALNALIRAAIHSPNYVPNVSGWSINKDGTAEFNNLTVRGIFQGNNFIINNAGFFLYSGTPAFGNLIATIASTPGTDAFGNTYLEGLTAIGSDGSITQLADKPGGTSGAYGSGIFFWPNSNTALLPPAVVTYATYPGELRLFSGQNGLTDGQSLIRFFSQTNTDPGRQFPGGSFSELDFTADQIYANGNINIQPGGGPFSINETFHYIAQPAATAAGFAGGVMRVKLLPWNCVLMELQMVINVGNNATTLTFGNLPSSLYYPLVTRHFPVVNTGTIFSRLFLPNSGGPQLIISAAGPGLTYGMSVMYGNN